MGPVGSDIVCPGFVCTVIVLYSESTTEVPQFFKVKSRDLTGWSIGWLSVAHLCVPGGAPAIAGG